MREGCWYFIRRGTAFQNLLRFGTKMTGWLYEPAVFQHRVAARRRRAATEAVTVSEKPVKVLTVRDETFEGILQLYSEATLNLQR